MGRHGLVVIYGSIIEKEIECEEQLEGVPYIGEVEEGEVGWASLMDDNEDPFYLLAINGTRRSDEIHSIPYMLMNNTDWNAKLLNFKIHYGLRTVTENGWMTAIDSIR